MIIHIFLINILCTQNSEDDYLPEIWEIDKDNVSQKSNEFGITPNIVRKSTERLEVLMHRRLMALKKAGLIKSMSTQSFSTPRHYYSTDYDQVLSNTENENNLQFRICSSSENLRKLADYDPEYLFNYEKSEFGTNRVLSKDADEDMENIDQKFRIKMDSNDGKSVLDLNKLDGCTKKSKGVFKRTHGNKKESCESKISEDLNKKPSDISFSDWLTNVFYKKKKSETKENLLLDKDDLSTKESIDKVELRRKSSFVALETDRNRIEKSMETIKENDSFTKEDSSIKKPLPRRRTTYYKSGNDPNINLNVEELDKDKKDQRKLDKDQEGLDKDKKDQGELDKDQEGLDKDKKDQGVLDKKENVIKKVENNDVNNLDGFTFHYIPNTVKKVVSDKDLAKYKKCFFHACTMFNTHKHIFNSFKKLVITYNRFKNKYFPNTDDTYTVEKLRRKVELLFESRSNRIKYMLLKLNEFENNDIVFRRLHTNEEKIHLNSKIIKYIKECTKDEKDYEFNDVAFLTCINDIAYETTYLDLAFYTLAKYCSNNFD